MLFYYVWFTNLDIFYKTKLTNSNFCNIFTLYYRKFMIFTSKVNYLHEGLFLHRIVFHSIRMFIVFLTWTR